MLEISRELHGKHMYVRKNNLSVIEQLSNGIADFLDRFDKKAGERLQSDLAETKKRLDDAAEKARKEGLNKIKQEQIERWKINELLKKEAD
jgi:uncharacterized membrane protein (DUF106 family)